jgi:hypothetical protein
MFKKILARAFAGLYSQHERSRMAELAAQLDSFRARRSEPNSPLACWSERAFSQNGEDGIVAEIFARLGRKVGSFIEIGAGDGCENNTIRWLLDSARGVWVEGSASNVAAIRGHHAKAIKAGQLNVISQMVNAENINQIIRSSWPANELDILSIDIDGNDYWVWKAIDAVDPVLVIVEYNGRYGSSLSWTMKYNPTHSWPGGNSYYGASLKALEKLGREKGYALIGVDYMGVNAFFLREDLVDEGRFPGPHTAEALFQPFRRSFGELPAGKNAAFGPYENP